VSEPNDKLLQRLRQVRAPNCPPLATLGDFLDEKLPPDDRRSIELHLQACPSCINRLIELRELAILQKEGEAVPEAVTRRAKDLVPRRIGTNFPRSLPVRLAVGLAAAIAVSFVVLLGVKTATRLRRSPLTLEVELNANQQRLISAVLVQSSANPEAFLHRIADEVRVRAVTHYLVGADTRLFVDNVAPSMVVVVTDRGVALGSLIDATGEVLTISDVISEAHQIAVEFRMDIVRHEAFTATPLKVDEASHLALLKVRTPPKLLHYLTLARGMAAKTGETIDAVRLEHQQSVKDPDPSTDRGLVTQNSVTDEWLFVPGTVNQVRQTYQWADSRGVVHHGTELGVRMNSARGDERGSPLIGRQGGIVGLITSHQGVDSVDEAVGVDVLEQFIGEPNVTSLPNRQRNQVRYNAESYGTGVISIYLNSASRLPDLWLVNGAATGSASYVAEGSVTPTQLDTVVEPIDPDWRSFAYYFDLNCDGRVDLAGLGTSGDGSIDRYELPTKDLRISSLAARLVAALHGGDKLPNPQIHVCGEGQQAVR
jgi:hypothetical protein